MAQESENNMAREIRKEFFAFRNGVVAEKLRNAGDPHTIIMGCLLADVNAIAQRTRDRADDALQLAALASELWADTNSRECRLVAPMLYPPQLMGQTQALQWCETVETTEIADNLCHKLLRHLSVADALVRHLIAQDKPLLKYTGYRLMLNLLLLKKLQPAASLKAIVEAETASAMPSLNLVLKDILEELDEQN